MDSIVAWMKDQQTGPDLVGVLQSFLIARGTKTAVSLLHLDSPLRMAARFQNMCPPGYSSRIRPQLLTLLPHTQLSPQSLSSTQPTGRRNKKEKKDTQEKSRQRKINDKYDALPDTQQFEAADGYVTFCRTFKYLGLRISYNLRDDANIEA